MRTAIIAVKHDNATVELLLKHAANMRRNGYTFVDVLNPTIESGSRWEDVLRNSLASIPSFDRFIIIVSANLIADNSWVIVERLLKDFNGQVYPLLVSPCDWKHTGLYKKIHPDTVSLKSVSSKKRDEYILKWLNDFEFNAYKLLP
jgi:hypothetical protein